MRLSLVLVRPVPSIPQPRFRIPRDVTQPDDRNTSTDPWDSDFVRPPKLSIVCFEYVEIEFNFLADVSMTDRNFSRHSRATFRAITLESVIWRLVKNRPSVCDQLNSRRKNAMSYFLSFIASKQLLREKLCIFVYVYP